MAKLYQCTLSQGSARTIGYIEDRGASVGKMVEIKDDGFEGFWRVESVGSHGIEATELREKQRKDRNFNQDI